MMFEQLPTLQYKKILHFSHNDMDGYAPQILSRLSIAEVIQYYHCGYNNFENKLEDCIEKLSNEECLQDYAILITDIAPTSHKIVTKLDELSKAGMTIVLIDHHDTARWIAEEFPSWAYINSYDEEHTLMKTSATSLFYDYLLEKDLFTDEAKNSNMLRLFVEQVRSYDTWDWTVTNNVSAKQLNTLLYILGPTEFLSSQIEKIKDFMFKEYTGLSVEETFPFNEMERLLIKLEEKKEQKYITGRMKTMFVRDWKINNKEYIVGVVYADQYHSVLGNELNERFKELDFVAIFDLNSNKASLRTIHDDIHVGNIAKYIAGGGGHQKAAGFEFEDKSKEILSCIEKGIGLV